METPQTTPRFSRVLVPGPIGGRGRAPAALLGPLPVLGVVVCGGGGVGALLGPEGTGPVSWPLASRPPCGGGWGGCGVGVVVSGGWGAGWRIGPCVLRVSGVSVGALLAVGCL